MGPWMAAGVLAGARRPAASSGEAPQPVDRVGELVIGRESDEHFSIWRQGS